MQPLNKSDITLKGVKSFLASDGLAFRATVYVRGVKAFVVENHGDGGENMYSPFEGMRPVLAECEVWAESQPPVLFEGVSLPYDLAFFIDAIMDEMETQKWLKRKCKGKTLYKLPGDADNTWRTVSHVYNDYVKAYLLGKYPTAIIGNELINS